MNPRERYFGYYRYLISAYLEEHGGDPGRTASLVRQDRKKAREALQLAGGRPFGELPEGALFIQHTRGSLCRKTPRGALEQGHDGSWTPPRHPLSDGALVLPVESPERAEEIWTWE